MSLTSRLLKNSLSLSLAAGFALTSPAAKAIQLVGVSSCGQWVQDRSTGQDEYVKTWLLGYLSGKAVAVGKDFLRNTENHSIYLWMDNYCRANPLKHIGDGAEDLAIELVRMKKL